MIVIEEDEQISLYLSLTLTLTLVKLWFYSCFPETYGLPHASPNHTFLIETNVNTFTSVVYKLLVPLSSSPWSSASCSYLEVYKLLSPVFTFLMTRGFKSYLFQT